MKVGDPDGPLVEVIGIAADVRSGALDKPPAITMYFPYWQQRAFGGPALVVKTAGGSLAISGAIRNAIHRIDAELPVPKFQTMEQIVEESVAQRRFQRNLILFFAAAALLLASLGIYGVVSYSVATRTNEMGIRMALGASGRDILGMVLLQAMAPVTAGLGAGLIGSVAARRLLAGLLYGVSPQDPVTVAGVVVTLAAIAVLASLIPALRAIHIEPSSALRNE